MHPAAEAGACRTEAGEAGDPGSRRAGADAPVYLDGGLICRKAMRVKLPRNKQVNLPKNECQLICQKISGLICIQKKRVNPRTGRNLASCMWNRKSKTHERRKEMFSAAVVRLILILAAIILVLVIIATGYVKARRTRRLLSRASTKTRAS